MEDRKKRRSDEPVAAMLEDIVVVGHMMRHDAQDGYPHEIKGLLVLPRGRRINVLLRALLDGVVERVNLLLVHGYDDLTTWGVLRRVSK